MSITLDLKDSDEIVGIAVDRLTDRMIQNQPPEARERLRALLYAEASQPARGLDDDV